MTAEETDTVRNSAEKISRFNLASCYLVHNDVNWVLWSLRWSRFEDIQTAWACIVRCIVRVALIFHKGSAMQMHVHLCLGVVFVKLA